MTRRPTTDPHLPGGPVGWRELVLVLALGLAAFGLRTYGIGMLLPQHFEWDSYVMGQTVELATDGELSLSDRRRAAYPLLLARLTALGRRWEDPARDPTPATLDEHLERCRAPARSTRLRLATIASLIVPLTWGLARLFLSRGAACFAAAIVAASLLHASFSQQVRPHAAAATFSLASVLASVSLARRGSLSRWLAAAAASGLALGALQSGLAVFPALALAVAGRVGDGRRRAWLLGLPLLATLASLACFYAPSLAAARLAEGGLRQGTHAVDWSMFDGRGFRQMLRHLFEYEPLLLLGLGLAAIGSASRAAGGWRAARAGAGEAAGGNARGLAVVLAYALPYALVIGIYGRTFQRFLIPLLPFLALFAAYGLGAIRAAVERRLGRGAARVLAWLAVLVLVGLPAATTLRQGWVRARPDTLEQLAEWIVARTRADERVRILRPLHLPPLFRAAPAESTWMREDGAERVYKWNLYEESLPAGAKLGVLRDLDFVELELGERHGRRESAHEILARLNADVVAVDPDPFRSTPSSHGAVLRALRQAGELVARFAPDEHDLYLLYEERHRPPGLPTWFVRQWRARAMGPVVEVYRVNAAR